MSGRADKVLDLALTNFWRSARERNCASNPARLRIMAENPARPVRPSQIANNIGIATISKPPVNPLSGDVCDKLLESFDEFEKAHVRVVIIRANPNTKVWSAGHDIREIPLDGHDAVHRTTGFVQVLRRIRYCPMPVIAMLHSSVWGAACDLAVTCDLAIGTPNTTF